MTGFFIYMTLEIGKFDCYRDSFFVWFGIQSVRNRMKPDTGVSRINSGVYKEVLKCRMVG